MNVEIVSVHNAAMPLCANANILRRALTADPAFNFEDTHLVHSGSFRCEYSANDWFKVDDKLGILHRFRFVSDGEVSQADCDAFSLMLRAFRTNLRTLDAERIETLWDDVSFRYCRLAYPMILNTENLMRRLIAQFMLRNLGSRWIELSAPKEVRDQIGKARRASDLTDPLHNVDFDTLVDYLTRPYASETADSMHNLIRGIDLADAEEVKRSIEHLKAMIPQSNWSRYFSAIVDCEDSLLRSKWNELYLLRCKVAHNTYLTSDEFKSVEALCSTLDAIISSAIAKLGQVEVSVADAVELESMATKLSDDVADATAIGSHLAISNGRRGSLRRKENLHLEMNRLRDVLRAVANSLGEPLPLENNVFDLQRILLRTGTLASEDSQLVDKAMEVISSRNLEYPPSTLIDLERRVRALRTTLAAEDIHLPESDSELNDDEA